MNTETTTLADQLVTEFRDVVRLQPVDARRAAFTALALRANWSKSKIGNYLGVSRARVTQKVDKIGNYVEPRRFREDMPVLTALMEQVKREYKTQYERGREAEDIVGYDAADWNDDEFAERLLALVTELGDPK